MSTLLLRRDMGELIDLSAQKPKMSNPPGALCPGAIFPPTNKFSSYICSDVYELSSLNLCRGGRRARDLFIGLMLCKFIPTTTLDFECISTKVSARIDAAWWRRAFALTAQILSGELLFVVVRIAGSLRFICIALLHGIAQYLYLKCTTTAIEITINGNKSWRTDRCIHLCPFLWIFYTALGELNACQINPEYNRKEKTMRKYLL